MKGSIFPSSRSQSQQSFKLWSRCCAAQRKVVVTSEQICYGEDVSLNSLICCNIFLPVVAIKSMMHLGQPIIADLNRWRCLMKTRG
ncbi:MAG: hypothetical protein IMZ53_06525 [Thermoplasmata archaeon]|nr:hypothetical protein [Thermoplasmata archaeon]